MTFNIKCMVLGIMFLGIFQPGYSQMPKVLKQFLKDQNFLDLIQKHKQEKITLRVSGSQGKDIAPPSIASVKKRKAPPPRQGIPFFYAIQVFATHDFSKAQHLKKKFENQVSHPVEIIQQQSLWKVLIGRFPRRDSAEMLLKKLRQRKFQDAWITQMASF